MKKTFCLIFFLCLFLQIYYAFFEHTNLVKHTVANSVISISEVVSMGRDDDDGKADKWHIGGLD